MCFLFMVFVVLFLRPTDSSAFKTIGKVIARRCLESGISSVYCDFKPEEGTKVITIQKIFLRLIINLLYFVSY